MDLLNPPDCASHPSLRECVSCKRDLPVNCFGRKRRNADGISFECRDCNSYYRRFSYKKRHEAIIIPLSPQNRHVFETIGLPTSGTVTFSARGVKDRGFYQVIVEIRRGSPSLTITNPTGTEIIGQYQCLGVPRDRFLELAIEILRDLKLRLSN